MMKRVITMIVLMSLTVVCFCQERIKQVLELRNGTSVTGFVMQQEDGSYLLETDSGDVLFYTSSEVRSLKTPSAESGESNHTFTKKINGEKHSSLSIETGLKRKGFSLIFTDTGQDLLPNQVSPSFWNDYRKASKGKKTGMWLMIGGGVVIITGSILSATIVEVSSGRESIGNGYYNTYYNEQSSPIGAIVASAGAGVAIWGAVKFFMGNAKLGNLAKTYNAQNGYSSVLSLDVIPAGLAIKYNF